MVDRTLKSNYYYYSLLSFVIRGVSLRVLHSTVQIIPMTIWKFQGPYGNSNDHMEIPRTIWKFHPVTIWKFQGPYGNSKDHMERLFRDCLLDCCAAVPSTGSKQKFWYQPSVSWYSQHYLGLLMHPGFLQS